jgi:DNA-binding transcriptional MerR regulator
MRIGELAARAGVSAKALRYYEQQELLSSVRSAAGQRFYSDNEVERVAYIQALYQAGLTSRTIAEVLPCVESPSEENSSAALVRLAQERHKLSDRISELMRTRDSLDRLMDAAQAHRDELRTSSAGVSAAQAR